MSKVDCQRAEASLLTRHEIAAIYVDDEHTRHSACSTWEHAREQFGGGFFVFCLFVCVCFFLGMTMALVVHKLKHFGRGNRERTWEWVLIQTNILER